LINTQIFVFDESTKSFGIVVMKFPTVPALHTYEIKIYQRVHERSNARASIYFRTRDILCALNCGLLRGSAAATAAAAAALRAAPTQLQPPAAAQQE
jgi:hypothetical protein